MAATKREPGKWGPRKPGAYLARQILLVALGVLIGLVIAPVAAIVGALGLIVAMVLRRHRPSVASALFALAAPMLVAALIMLLFSLDPSGLGAMH